jgi:SAM-dependent methyltransferase
MTIRRNAGLVLKVLTLEVSPRVLLYVGLGKLDHWVRAGISRYEFERLYLEDGDHWGFYTKSYERRKYDRTLSCAVEWRRGAGRVLEVGCSVGAFTQMLAGAFGEVVALDISAEALKLAIGYVRDENVKFVQDDLVSAQLEGVFDVIFCAEVLYYVRRQDAARVCEKLANHVAPNGLIIMVDASPPENSDSAFFHDWDKVLSAHFDRTFNETVSDDLRPYQIFGYSNRGGKTQPLGTAGMSRPMLK